MLTTPEETDYFAIPGSAHKLFSFSVLRHGFAGTVGDSVFFPLLVGRALPSSVCESDCDFKVL